MTKSKPDARPKAPNGFRHCRKCHINIIPAGDPYCPECLETRTKYKREPLGSETAIKPRYLHRCKTKQCNELAAPDDTYCTACQLKRSPKETKEKKRVYIDPAFDSTFIDRRQTSLDWMDNFKFIAGTHQTFDSYGIRTARAVTVGAD